MSSPGRSRTLQKRVVMSSITLLSPTETHTPLPASPASSGRYLRVRRSFEFHLESSTAVAVAPLRDSLIDRVGHDPRSAYAERFWLPVLGPTTAWLLRSIAWGFDSAPDGYLLDVGATAEGIGIAGTVSRNGPIVRSLTRACQFDAMSLEVLPDGTPIFHVRRHLPWLSRRLVETLPAPMRDEHRSWVEAMRTPSPSTD
jgi:hypothetical protein